MVIVPRAGGMIPVRLFPDRLRPFSFVRLLMRGGMTPVKRFPLRSKRVKLEQFVSASIKMVVTEKKGSKVL